MARRVFALIARALPCTSLGYAARAVRNSPGFTAAAALSLALGIGAATAVFSIADTVFLRPLPYPNADRLVWVAIRFPSIKAEFVPSPDFVAWRRDNTAFEELAATQADGGSAAVVDTPAPAEVHVARVSRNFLAALGIHPELGRSFNKLEELPDGPRAVLLTNTLWRSRFDARRGALGQTITIDGQPHTIVGILPKSFVFPMDVQVDMLTALPISPAASHGDRGMSTWAVFGRLKPGVRLAQGRADLERLFARSKADAPLLFRSDTSLVAQPLQEHRAGEARLLLPALSGAAAFLLLIACANAGNLMLARWAARSRELAVRAAIGASRARLIGQLLTEGVLLASIGCAAGTLLAAAAMRGFVLYAGRELPRLDEVAMDARAFGIALSVSAFTVLLFGVLPAMRAGRVDIQQVLQRTASPAAGWNRVLRRGLVTAEIALCLTLLSGALLLLETLWRMEHDHLGFEPEHVLTASIPLNGNIQQSKREVLAEEILSRLRRLPGVQAAATGECTPLTTGPVSVTFSRADRPLPEAFHRGDNITACGAGPDYFEAAGMRLVRGRFITREDFDHPGTVAVINQAAARAYFPDEDPLGKRIAGGRQGAWKTVIGIAADTKNHGLNMPPVPTMFLNNLALWPGSDLQFVIRGAGAPEAVVSEIRGELHAFDPGLYARFETLDAAIGESAAGPRFNSVLLACFAGIAFVMAIVGVYGVLAYSVSARTREIGIRMALGADERRVLQLVVREGASLFLAGASTGLGGALVLTRYLRAMLYEVSPTDPATLAAALAALGIAALMATSLPARRAASVDPSIALRHD